MPTLEVQLLGPPIIARDGEPLAFATRKAIALLAYLALEPGSHPRRALAALFWPGSGESAAHGALRYTLSILKQSIGEQWLVSDRWNIGLAPSGGPVCDVAQFHACLQGAGAHDHPAGAVCWRCLPLLRQAADLYRADFMQGFALDDSPQFDEWQRFQDLALRDALAGALDRLVQLEAAQSNWDQAIADARRRLTLDPLHESAHQQLMRLYAWAGRRTAALSQYQECADLLRRELGAPPSQETQDLLHAVTARQLPPPAGMPGAISPAPARRDPNTARQQGDLPPAARGTEEGLVAREPELARLQSWLQAAGQGRGHICFVVGEAGSGKTALLQAFARAARAGHAGLVVASSGCTAHVGAGDPFQPFRNILLQLATLSAPSLLDLIVRHGPDLLGVLLPPSALSDLPPAALAAAAVSGSDAAPSEVATQLQLYDQFTAVLCAVATHSPLLLLVDDLQWADPSSLNLLSHLGHCVAPARILLVGAYRSDEVASAGAAAPSPPAHSLPPIVAELRRSGGDILVDLDQANAAGGRAFVDALLDREPNRLDERFRTALYRQTEGHPLFTVELLQELRANGSLRHAADGSWITQPPLSWHTFPSRVEAVLAGQLGRMADSLREVLAIAAVEGETFTVEVLARVQAGDTLTMLHYLAPLAADRYRFAQPGDVEYVNGRRLTHFRFRHILLQQYIYAQLSAGEKAYLHEEIASALEELYGSATDRIALHLAYHFEMGGSTAKAVQYLTQAGQRAQRVAARAEAGQHLTHAADRLAALPDTPETGASRRALELPLQMALGVAYTSWYGYAVPAGGQAFARAVQLSREMEGMPYLGQVVRGLASFHLIRAEFQEARRQDELLLALAQQQADAELLGLAHMSLGVTLFYLAEYERARRHLESALTFAACQPAYAPANVQATEAAVVCRTHLAFVLWSLGYPDQALACSDAAREIALASGHPPTIAHALALAATVCRLRREWLAAQACIDEAFAYAVQHHQPFWEANARLELGAVLLELGDVRRGLALLEQGIADFKAVGAEFAMPQYLGDVGRAHALLGEVNQGLRVLDSALALVEKTGERWWEPELYRFKAQLLLLAAPTGAGAKNTAALAATDALRRSIAAAEGQGARCYVLRSAADLCCLYAGQAAWAEAIALLTSHYRWFSEGFATPDLVAAAALLAL